MSISQAWHGFLKRVAPRWRAGPVLSPATWCSVKVISEGTEVRRTATSVRICEICESQSRRTGLDAAREHDGQHPQMTQIFTEERGEVVCGT